MAKKIEKIQHGCQMVAFHNGRQTKTFCIILDQNSSLLFGFFTCLDLYCIHINCIILEV